MTRVLRQVPISTTQRWTPTEVERATLPDPQQAYNAMMSRAVDEAEAMIEAAKADAEALRQRAQEEGYAHGYAEGEARGLADAQAQYAARNAALDMLVDEVNRARAAFYDSAETELVRLAMAIARKVVDIELTTRPEVIVDIVRGHMLRIREREVLRLRVNPADVPLLDDARESLRHDVDGVRELVLEEDRRIERGGVIIETPNGALDARVPPQFDTVALALESALEAPDGTADR